MTAWSDWIGRTEIAEDRCSPTTLAALAAVLDADTPPWRAGEAPPLFHWLHFLPTARQSAIGQDGHPARGGFLPPVDLPRRMWAGGRLEFLAPVAPDAPITRVSTIRRIEEKTGSIGRLVFVTVEHVVSSDGVPAVREEQDLVYRDPSGAAGPGLASGATPPPKPTPPEPTDAERTMVADPVLLFRFSALTFNAHRIHYDRDYARGEEDYPGLVVQGPLLATLLMDHALRHADGRRPARFAFAARRPLFDGVSFALCLAEAGDTARLWTRAEDGAATMTATLSWATP